MKRAPFRKQPYVVRLGKLPKFEVEFVLYHGVGAGEMGVWVWSLLLAIQD